MHETTELTISGYTQLRMWAGYLVGLYYIMMAVRAATSMAENVAPVNKKINTVVIGLAWIITSTDA